MKQAIKANNGALAGAAELYDTGSSSVEIDLGPVARALVILWAFTDMAVDDRRPRPFVVKVKEGSPWVEVKTGPLTDTPREYAIWRATGDIYAVTEGAVGDDPILEM